MRIRTMLMWLGLPFLAACNGSMRLVASAAYPVSETEHGLRTSRVIATRYKNSAFGYNIGFDFPEDPDNCDRAEISDFMGEHDGWPYQSGGFAGATMYVKFKDVTDKESANKKLSAAMDLQAVFQARAHGTLPQKVERDR